MTDWSWWLFVGFALWIFVLGVGVGVFDCLVRRKERRDAEWRENWHSKL